MIGCGVVGQGMLQVLHDHAQSIEARLGARLDVRRIAVRSAGKDRGPHAPAELLCTDPMQVVSDPKVDIVVEVMGGVEPAGRYVEAAIEAGRPVVTANKALLAERAHALIDQAESRGVDLYFEAAVAGGVPVIRVLREALASDEIEGLYGIINGTSNYILSQMRDHGLDFGVALAQAQAAGYAEADPTLDIGGGDAAHKLTILATLAYGCRLELSEIPTEGIDRVSALDIQFAERFGYVIKPLGVAQRTTEGKLDLRVHPSLIKRDHVLSNVSGALNAVFIKGAAVGPSLLSGLGAGALPTATSVVSDVIDVGRNLLAKAVGRVPQRSFIGSHIKRPSLQAISDHRCRFYLRFAVLDQSGVLARLAGILGDHGVSIEQMVQDGHGEQEPVAVVLLTHPASEGDVRAALTKIDQLEVVVEPACALRIEDT